MPHDVNCDLEEKQGKHNTEIPIITTISELEKIMKEKNWHISITLGKRFIVEDSNNMDSE